MEKSNKLTEKEFWSEGWKKIKIPARYFYGNYSHVIISDVIQKYVAGNNYKSFLEIGGCPGRWADYFFSKFGMECDSMDYDENNVIMTNKNYELLGIKGKAFLGDITNPEASEKKYDVVLSDGLVEHFVDSSDVFKNHLSYLNKGGLLVIGVPNIKKSWFYDYFARKDKIGYNGYRHFSKKELMEHAKRNNLEVFFCDYIGVFNIGLVHSYALSTILAKLFVAVSLFLDALFKVFNVRRECDVFSPYIYLIAKKNE